MQHLSSAPIDAVQTARSSLEALKAKAAELRKLADALDSQTAELQAQLLRWQQAGQHPAETAPQKRRTSRWRSPRVFKHGEQIDLCTQVLKMRSPLTPTEIAGEMLKLKPELAREVHLVKRVSNTVYAFSRTNARYNTPFVRVSRGMFALKK